MSYKDKRVLALATAGKMRTAGRIVVRYRDASGNSQDALVLAAGSSSGLKIALGSEGGRIIDNVAFGYYCA